MTLDTNNSLKNYTSNEFVAKFKYEPAATAALKKGAADMARGNSELPKPLVPSPNLPLDFTLNEY